MIENPELFEKYFRNNYPDLYKKVERKLVYSPSTSTIGFLNVCNPTDNKDDAAEFERIISEYNYK